MTDYSSVQRKRNMIVGGFVIIAFCVFVWMIWIFGELPVAVSKYRSFVVYVNFPSAPGVQKNTPVQYCGYQIGRAINVMAPQRILDTETGALIHQVKVTVAIDRQYVDIPSNVKVKLIKRGLGSSYIEFGIDSQEPVTAVLVEGTQLQGSAGVSSEFFPKEVQQKIESLVDSVNAFAKNANDIIGDKESQTDLRQALANIAEMTKQATEAFKSIKTFSQEGTATLTDTGERLSEALLELRQLLAEINDGQGTMGKLVNDGRLYENLLDSSEELQVALEQLKLFIAQANEKGLKIKW